MSLLWGCDYKGCGRQIVVLSSSEPREEQIMRLLDGWRQGTFGGYQRARAEYEMHLCPEHADLMGLHTPRTE